MNFELTPKAGDRTIIELTTPFNGTRTEAYRRAVKMANMLNKMVRRSNVTILIARTDGPGEPYEVGADGHTVDNDNHPRKPRRRVDRHHQQA